MRDDTQLRTRTPRRRRESGSRGLAALLAAATERNPDGLAVLTDDAELSYRELDARSNRLARRLCALGIGPEDLVAVALPRSVDSVVAIWAIAKTGAAFVPLDPAYPRARVEYQLTDSGSTFGITYSRYVPDLPTEVKWLAVDDPQLLLTLAEDSPSPISYLDRRAAVRMSNIAYVTYTSGSTGRPKGAAVTHSGLPALCADLRTRLSITQTARVLHIASPSFDASVLELLLAIGSAATMVIAPPSIFGGADLADFLHRHRITHAFLTPSVLATIDPAGLQALTTIAVGGEACPPALLRQWASTGRRFHNLYGPTETTIVATMTGPLYVGTAVTIGGPVDGLGSRILDNRLRPTAFGAIGELYVTGQGLARGYPGHSEPTAARFVADPWGTPGSRMYRTGDLVRRVSAGELEYHGRVDHQVKVRGLRIELGEIDATLTRLPEVARAVTIDRKTVTGATELVSFVQGVPGRPPRPQDLMTALAAELPVFMLPNSVTVVDEFPLTITGKLDRMALSALPVSQFGSQHASDVGEDMVIEVFAQVLGHRQLGSDSDFFAVGGNSLLVTQVAARLSKLWKVRIPPQLLFEHPTVATLTKAIRSQHFDTSRPALLAGVRPDRIPLSPNQLRFWLRNQFDTAAGVDNVGFALRLPGIDLDSLRGALLDVVTRHEALRTRYPADSDGPRQEIVDPDAMAHCFAVEDVAEEEVSERVHQVLRRGFDVTSDVPLRVRLLRTSQEQVLVCALHHICADGSSLAPLAHDLTLAYTARQSGSAPAWQPVQVQYADYALWQQELLGARSDADSLLSQQLRYWTTELQGLPDQLDLPADRRRPAVASLRGATVDQMLPATLHAALLSLARSHQASLFMVMRSALAILLARLSGTSDIAIGVPMTTRADPALDGVVGMFVNTTVSRTRVDLTENFLSLLSRSRTVDLANFAHSEVPFEHVVDAIDPVRSPGRHPLYQIGFAFQNFTRPELEMTGTPISMFDVEVDSVKSDLHIGVVDVREIDGTPGPIDIRFGYSTDLFDRTTVQGFVDAYIRVLHAILEDPLAPVGDLALTDTVDRRELYSGAAHPVEREPLTAALARQAAERPAAIAVTCGSDSISYGELYDRATRLARWLIARGIGPESIVAVAIRRSIEQVVALYAVAEAGAAWVPIDLDHPHERIDYILNSAAPQCVLSTTADNFTLGEHYNTDTIDTTGFDTGPVRDDERIAALHGDHPAYVIYTSGSTGRPKGVVVTHTAIVNQIAWMRARYRVEAHDTYLHKTAATFDVSLWGYFLPLWAGAHLVLAAPGEQRDPEAICRLVQAHRVTLTDFVPTMLTLVARSAQADSLRSLRAVFVIGEALAPDTARDFAAVCAAELHNLYGPTEAAVSITEHHVQDADLDALTVPIGVPAWNSECRVLDARLHSVPIGVTGELALAGDQLARGYHGAPGLTAARFVASAFGPPGARMYRSGDLVRRRGDGALEYLGRTDFQVKVRGHRIELGEIESVLLDDPAVAQAAVAVRRLDADDRLIGYVVARPGTTVDPKQLRHTLSERLPGYMVPSTVMMLDSLPVNTSGKLDRNALPDPVFTSEAAVPPATPLEHAIAEVFGEVLGVSGVGATDDFFELGGSSLLVFVVHQQLSQRLNREIPMSAILAAPSVMGLAAYVAGEQDSIVRHTPADDAVLAPGISALDLAPLRQETPRELLLTGVTGFLGAHLLHELLTQTDANVWCLVRNASQESPLDPILASFRRYRLPTEQIAERVSVVRGDLSAPRFGLDTAEFDLLTERIDAIYHNGARVNHVEPYERLREANVDGTISVLELATTRRVKTVHFISTLGAAMPAGRVPALVSENERIPAEHVQDNGYLASKWVGEELVRQAGERAVPVTIYRPGTICGHTGLAVNNPDDAFWNMMRAAALLGMAPDVGDATVSLVPVDYVARAIVAIGTQVNREAVYHLVNHTPLAVGAVLRALSDHGRPVTTAPLDTVRAELERQSAVRFAAGDDSLARAVVLAPTYAGLSGHTEWSDTHTREALRDSGIQCPPIDKPVLDRYIEHFTATGFL